MRRSLAYAAAKRELVAMERPVDWMRPSIFRPPEVLTELEAVEAEKELKALQRHALRWRRLGLAPQPRGGEVSAAGVSRSSVMS